ncbi:hypothetical protein [Comamonas thiooxydans]|uniref:hypothetical protein n=1 Tax=Comamonas thiooxydans TaxID=363952 RepID=UPI00211553C6|nr:hypothetical protein [Comamonas thiooxydans]UUE94454.1 hypothetical protein MJ608_01890 [Comamonas thiooxydans]
MLNDAELSRLCSQLALTSEAMGHALSPAAAAMMADDLSIYPLQALERALKRVRAQHTGKLGTKVVLDQLEALAGRLAPSEAWALALKSNDEGETIVWTDEICQALEQSMPLLRAGDKVGARMAFIAAYERITITAREQRLLPTVQVTFGTNRELRQLALTTAIERNQISAPMAVVLALDNGVTLPADVFNSAMLGKAVEMGLIKADAAQDALIHGRLALVAPALSPVALLAGRVEVTREAAPDVREKLGQLRDQVARRAGRFTRAQVQARAERMRLSHAKRQTAARVLAYQQGEVA